MAEKIWQRKYREELLRRQLEVPKNFLSLISRKKEILSFHFKVSKTDEKIYIFKQIHIV